MSANSQHQQCEYLNEEVANKKYLFPKFQFSLLKNKFSYQKTNILRSFGTRIFKSSNQELDGILRALLLQNTSL